MVSINDEEERNCIISCTKKLAELIVTNDVPDDTVKKWCDKAGVSSIYDLDEVQVESCIKHINKNYAQEVA